MSKLTYWRCANLDEHTYSIRERTRHEAEVERWKEGVDRYADAEKVTIEYYGGAFGLMKAITGDPSAT